MRTADKIVVVNGIAYSISPKMFEVFKALVDVNKAPDPKIMGAKEIGKIDLHVCINDPNLKSAV
jgi:hypothetical protein